MGLLVYGNSQCACSGVTGVPFSFFYSPSILPLLFFTFSFFPFLLFPSSFLPHSAPHSFPFSSYPSKRSKTDDGGHEVGVVGSVGLLQTVTFSSQPISSLDWSPDKVTACTHTDTHKGHHCTYYQEYTISCTLAIINQWLGGAYTFGAHQ